MTPEEIERHTLDINQPPLPSLAESTRISLQLAIDIDFWKKDINQNKLTKLYNVVSILIKKSLISPESGINCPYWYAHLGSCTAVNEAYKELDRRQSAKQQKLRLEQVPKLADKLDAAYHGFLTGINTVDFQTTGERPIIDHDDDASIERYAEVCKLQNELRSLREATIKAASALISIGNSNVERLSHNGAGGKVWHQTFAERMGVTWCTLTGQEPGQWADFKNFLSAAYELCGGSRDFDWTSTIDTICARMACDIETPRKWPGKGGWDQLSSKDPWGIPDRRRREESHEAKAVRHYKRGHEIKWAIDTLYNGKSHADKRDANLLLKEAYNIHPETEEGRRIIGDYIRWHYGFTNGPNEPSPTTYPRPNSLEKSKLKSAIMPITKPVKTR